MFILDRLSIDNWVMPSFLKIFKMVSILQFNILADHLSDAFPLVDKDCLKWENRKTLILEHILQKSPDIICLEEVDHFTDWFQPELAKFGYTGYFITKKVDGCALFFKHDKFRAGSGGIRLIKLSDYLPAPFNKTSQQVAIVAHLRTLDFANIIIGMTHLKAKYGFDEMRLEQIKIVCEKINELRDYLVDACPILLAGDFNADPDSNVVKYVSQQFNSSLPLDNSSFFTTWKIRPPEENKRTIDYIFHSNNLVCNDTFCPNDEATIPYPRLPSSIFPSDHLPIYARFEFMKISHFDQDIDEEFNICNLSELTPTLEEQPWLKRICTDSTKKIYQQVVYHYGMNKWIHLHPFYETGNLAAHILSSLDLDSLKSLSQIRCASGRSFKNADLDNFSAEFISFIERNVKVDGVFARMSHKSVKDGFNKLIPLKSVSDVLDSLTSSAKLLQTFVDPNQILVIMSWVDIQPEKEYRVFVINNRIAAISQQNCYSNFERGNGEVENDVKMILKYYSRVKDEFYKIGYESATLDIYIGGNEARLIEINPPTLWCASGSSLFNKKELLSFKNNTIYVKVR